MSTAPVPYEQPIKAHYEEIFAGYLLTQSGEFGFDASAICKPILPPQKRFTYWLF